MNKFNRLLFFKIYYEPLCRKQNGYSILSTLIFMTISSAIVLGISSNIQFQNSSIMGLNDKLVVSDLESQISQLLQVDEYCSCFMRGSTLNINDLNLSNTPTSIPVGYEIPIPASVSEPCVAQSDKILQLSKKQTGTKTKNQYRLDRITFEKSSPISINQYLTKLNLSVSIDGRNNFKSITIPITYGVDMSDPSSSAKKFQSCGQVKVEPVSTILRSGWVNYTATETGLHRVDFIGTVRGRTEGETYIWMTLNNSRNPAFPTEVRCGQRDAKSGGNSWIHCPFHMTELWNLTSGTTYTFGHGGIFPGGGFLLNGGASEATWIITKEDL